MFQFSNSEPMPELSFYSGVFNQFPTFRTVLPVQNQRTLQNVKMQTQYLVSEVNSLKQVMKNLASSVKQTLNQMGHQLVAIKKAAESQRPKKKFKKVIMCPMDQCGRKYSSKIALNCHIRNKHSSREY